MKSRLAFWILAAGVLFVPACGGDATGAKGSLLLTRPAGLVEHKLDGGTETLLIPAPGEGSVILDPALSADAMHITYVVQPKPAVKGNQYDDGSDLWIANRDGTGARMVFAHAERNQVVRNPQWQDADHIVAVVQEVDATTGITDYVLERFTVADGTRQHGPSGVLTFSFAPDGKRIVFALAGRDGSMTLHASDFGGGNDAVLVGSAANLGPFNSPRHSPDGGIVAFAAVNPSGVQASFEYVSASASRIQPGPGLHDDVEDIWTVDLVGGKPVLAVKLAEDSPSIAWSGSPSRMYVLGANGLYSIDMKTGAADRIGEGSLHGQLAFAP